MKLNKKNILIFTTVVVTILIVYISFTNEDYSIISDIDNKITNSQIFVPKKDISGDILYKGTIYSIFFHSLIVYPELAFNGNKSSELYKKYMITRDEFVKILPELYNNNFVLIDINSIYTINKNGTVVKKPLYLPKDKKPLIISLDDLSYYKREDGHGFAKRLVFDKNGNIATLIIMPNGQATTTNNGDVVPILDKFVKEHPDFSIDGAKGVIALTGYEGVLGYRTEATTSKSYSQDIQSAKKIIDKLKSTGWSFASHSYSHDRAFSNGTISLEALKKDVQLWDKEVRPLVGDTNIFIGPYGQIFSQNDPRRSYILSDGFKIIYGVGTDLYFHFFYNYLVMDRVNIDSYRLTHNQDLLRKFFDPNIIINSVKK